jgi:SHS2 domain-containing protein
LRGAALHEMRFEQFEHGADVGVRGFGATPEEAFEGAASALFSLVAGDLASVRDDRSEMLTCSGPDLPELLVAFLNELISRGRAERLGASENGPHARPWKDLRDERERGASLQLSCHGRGAEEAPGAYKDVEEVAKVAEDVGLSKRVARLRPIACIKG